MPAHLLSRRTHHLGHLQANIGTSDETLRNCRIFMRRIGKCHDLLGNNFLGCQDLLWNAMKWGFYGRILGRQFVDVGCHIERRGIMRHPLGVYPRCVHPGMWRKLLDVCLLCYILSRISKIHAGQGTKRMTSKEVGSFRLYLLNLFEEVLRQILARDDFSEPE